MPRSEQRDSSKSPLAGLDVVGCDVVEVAPAFDGPGHITSLLAANIMFELLCVIARKGGP